MTWPCGSGTSGSFAGNAEGDSCDFFTGDDASQGSELGFWLWVSSAWGGPAVSLVSFQSDVGTEPAWHLYLSSEPALRLAYAESFPGSWSFTDVLSFPPTDCWCWVSLSAGFGALAWSLWANDGTIATGHEAMPGPSGGYAVTGAGPLALGKDVSGLGGGLDLGTDGGVKLAKLLYVELPFGGNQTDPVTGLTLVQELSGEGSRLFLMPRFTDWPGMASARAGNFSGSTGAFSGNFADAGQGYGFFTTAPNNGLVFAEGPQSSAPQWVRLRHSSGHGYWQSDGDTVEEWAGGARRLVLPLPTLGSTPSTLVGQDPATGLPAFCPAPPASPGGTLPAGTEPGDLLWWDGAAWQVLSPDGVPGHVLTEVVGGGGAVLPEWGGALASDSAIMCGMARFLAAKIQIGFEFLRTQTLAALQLWVLHESFAVSVLLQFYTVLDPAFGVFSGALTALNAAVQAGDTAGAAVAFPPLTPGQVEGIVCACYCGLHDTTGSGALTTTTLDRIRHWIDVYPNWIAAGDGHYYQKEAIDVLLQTSLDWATWAEIGSHAPQDTCGHCSCG